MSTVDRIGMARAKPVREFSHPKGGATAAPMTPLPAPFQGLATVVAITVVGVMLIKVLDRI